MANSKVAKEFFEQHLPVNVKKAIDPSTIKLQKDSFIDDNLKQQAADLLFSVDFDGKHGYIYLLLEHQSKPDEFMPFRMLKYMIAVMEQHLKQIKKPNKKRLPIVYPMIFYSGNKPYKYSTDLFDLFEGDKKLARDILWQPCQLIDLTKIPDEKLKETLLSGLFARAMKYIHESDEKILVNSLRMLMKDLSPVENISGIEYIYMLH